MDDRLLMISKTLITQALTEDLGERGDITTLAIANDDRIAEAKIIAKQSGVIAGVDIAVQVFKTINHEISCGPVISDGDYVENRDTVINIKGKASDLLSAERTALNFMGRLSGIATHTRRFVDEIKGTQTHILDTRKTIPGWRMLEKYAVVCGGGMNHRIGLHDMFLIKENHISHAGGIDKAVDMCREYMKKHHFNVLIEVETRNIDEFKTALKAKADRIMLDNMSLETISECIKLNIPKIPLEISGNVNLDTIKSLAETGVDYISIGALTHSAANFDLSMLIG